jgi:hypothetical protein
MLQVGLDRLQNSVYTLKSKSIFLRGWNVIDGSESNMAVA